MKRVKRLLAALLSLCIVFCLFPATLSASASESTGTFTAVCMNVDGLPQKIFGFTLNGDGPGSEGSKAISAKMAGYGWDIIGVSEDFNYNTELMSSLTSYQSGTHRGGVSRLYNDTDGLNLIWKNTISVSGEKWTSWNTHYSTGIFNTGNGADGMIDKGYRYYKATIAQGVSIDVYILHMDADSDAEDIAARESQLTQLADAIKASKNGNPIIVMGDTNCRYTREQLKTLFIDAINADKRFTIQDAWIEKVRNGEYPVYGSDALVAKDKGGTYDYPDAEIVDKLFYINNTESNVVLTAESYTIATDFTDSEGKALADHWPVVADFSYTVSTPHTHSYVSSVTKNATCTEKGVITYTCACGDTYTEEIPALGHSYQSVESDATCTEKGSITYTCTRCGDTYSDETPALGHSYQSSEVPATCTEKGSITYTCTRCGDTYSEEIPALGHDFVNGTCSRCGADDPDAGSSSNPATLGGTTTQITSGSRYALVFHSTAGNYALNHDENGNLSSAAFRKSSGDTVDDSLIWTVTEQDGGYVLSAEVDGKTMYLARTKTFVGYGFRIGLREEPFVWSMKVDSSKESLRFYTRIIRSDYYLRYYNANVGWIVSIKAAGIKLHEVSG